MKGTAKSKVVTSGRLTGGVAAPPARRRVSPNPGAAARPEPAYSLYSTDSEEQVTSLHQGLDRCAALLSGILQAEKAEASSGLPRAAKAGAAKSRPCSSPGRKTIRKLRGQTGQRSCQSVQQRGPGGTSPRTTRQPAAPPRCSPPPPSHSPPRQRLSPAAPAPQPSMPPPQTSFPPPAGLPQTDRQSAPCQAGCDAEEEEVVPVRDTHSQVHTCTLKMSGAQLEPGRVDAAEVPPLRARSGEGCGAEAGVGVKTAQHLLGELKALIAGQGSVAERLLSQLEQTVSSPLMNVGQTEPDLSSLYSQNTQLRRRVRILHQQLKEREKAEKQQNTEALCNSEAEEFAAAQARLQELRGELAELRKALQDTRSQLRDREAANEVIKTDLEATRSRLLDSEREKSELASLAQQRLEEIRLLNRTRWSRDPSDHPAVVDRPGSGTLLTTRHQHRQDAAEPPVDRVAQYLVSLGQLEATRTAEGHTPEQKNPAETPARRQSPPLDQSCCFAEVQSRARQRLENSTLSRWDAESVRSDWSARSGSTFDTRDEAAFRDGLAALDASIASLQKTMQLDLGR